MCESIFVIHSRHNYSCNESIKILSFERDFFKNGFAILINILCVRNYVNCNVNIVPCMMFIAKLLMKTGKKAAGCLFC